MLESKRSSLMQVHDQGHRDGAAALPVVLCILVLPREEGRGGSVPPLSGTGWGATCRERIALMDLLDLAYLLDLLAEPASDGYGDRHSKLTSPRLLVAVTISHAELMIRFSRLTRTASNSD